MAFHREILPASAQLLQADDPVTIGGHRLTGRLTSRGTGVVYLARGRGARLVTVHTTRAGTTESGPVRSRLRAEVACIRRLPASCAAPVLYDGTDETPPYLISAHVDGPSLERVIDAKGPLPPAMVTALAADLARVIAAVHDAGVVHGNLTPANVVLTSDGLRVLDFGVARRIPVAGEPAEIAAVADNPGWLAPELLTGGPAGPACDVFGWGCLVAYAATGHSPYAESRTGPAGLDTGTLDGSLRSLVDAAAAEEPGSRPPAADLATALEALPQPGARPVPGTAVARLIPVSPAPSPLRRPPRRRRARSLVSALVTAAALLVAAPAGDVRTPAHLAPHPATPPSAPSPRAAPMSNTAAMSANAAPPSPSPVRTTRPAPRTRPRPRRTVVWMTCSATRPAWCSVPQVGSAPPSPGPSGRRITWPALR